MKRKHTSGADKVASINVARASVRSVVPSRFAAREWFAVALASLLLAMLPGYSGGSNRRPPAQSAGVLDNTFGNGGTVVSDFGMDSFASETAIQPDGKVIVVGNTGAVDQGQLTVAGTIVARYNPDGTLDMTFGAKGFTTITTSRFGASGIALQPDGKIVLAGATAINVRGAFLGQLTLARLNSDGSMDSSFGIGGLAVDGTGGPFVGLSVAIQGDGKIVAVGSFSGPSTGGLLAVRYNSDGTPDPTFGTGGAVLRGPVFASAVAIQPDGKIVLAGTALTAPAIVRLNPDGSADTTFGAGGVLTVSSLSPGGAIYGLVLQFDGKMVIVGTTFTTASVTRQNFLLLRSTASGTLDESFGAGGVVTTDLDGLDDAATAVAVQKDGKIVVVGTGFPAPTAQGGISTESFAGLTLGFSLFGRGGSFGLARYNSDGSLDTTFGQSGKVITSFPQQTGAAAMSLGIQPDGRILAAGTAAVGSRKEFALARYVTGPAADFSLGFSQSSISAARGTKAIITVTINRAVGFNEVVTVSAPNTLPAGIVLKGSSTMATSGSSAVFAFKVKQHAIVGSDQLTFSGTDASGSTRTATVTLVVQ